MSIHDPLLIRPVRETDLAAISDIAGAVGPGFTSLPKSPKVLSDKIQRSVLSFSGKLEKPGRIYFFVMENSQKQVMGTTAIEVETGFHQPFYCFKILSEIQSSPSLNKVMENKILIIDSDFQRTSMLGSLFLHSEWRGEGRGEFLSLSRFLFIAEFPELFSDHFIAWMRGVFDEQGRSPFWEGLLRHFFDMEHADVNFKIATESTQFIADLAPKYPIYIALLNPEARATIGKPNVRTAPALHVLEKEGFEWRDSIDLSDGGPILEASLKNLNTIRKSQILKIAECKSLDKLKKPELYMVSNASLDFKATLTPLEILDAGQGSQIMIDEKAAAVLGVGPGSKVRICKFREK